MAIYEYKCEECGNIFEVLQYPGEEPPRACPKCGSAQPTRLISSPTVLRKGGISKGGATCCGRPERCDRPPCTDDGVCKRD